MVGRTAAWTAWQKSNKPANVPAPAVKIELRLALFTQRGEPAGFRLQKGHPLPIEKFDFAMEDLDGAKAAVIALQKYLDDLELKKKPHAK